MAHRQLPGALAADLWGAYPRDANSRGVVDGDGIALGYYACCVLRCARDAVTTAERFRFTSCRLPAYISDRSRLIANVAWCSGATVLKLASYVARPRESEGLALPDRACSCSTSISAGQNGFRSGRDRVGGG